jgi:hypothetical protein
VTYRSERIRFSIPCSTAPGRFDAVVSFTWRARNADVAHKASVRDLFDSLADAIVRSVAPRQLHVGIALQ